MLRDLDGGHLYLIGRYVRSCLARLYKMLTK